MSAVGIDWSHYNGPVDWGLLRAQGKSFGWGKVTQGDSYVDPWFSSNAITGRANGFAIGGYHFVDPTVPAVKQADWFLTHLGKIQYGDLRLAMDLETAPLGKAQAADCGAQVIQRLRAVTGIRPMTYTPGRAWWGGTDLSGIAINSDLWYPDPPPPSPLPIGFASALCTQVGQAAGFDINVTDNLAALRLLAPLPPPNETVAPAHDWSISHWVDDAAWPRGGAILLTADGATFSVGGAPYLGGANGKPYFVNQKACRLEYMPPPGQAGRLPDDNNYPEGVRIVNAFGQRYRYTGDLAHE